MSAYNTEPIILLTQGVQNTSLMSRILTLCTRCGFAALGHLLWCLFILSHDWVTVDGIWTGNWIYWSLKHTTHDYNSQITITRRLVFSVAVFTVLLGSKFQWCSVLNFRVQRLLSCLAGTFLLQLPSWTNWLPTAELTRNVQATPYVAPTWAT
jgi:hypothetical protein